MFSNKFLNLSVALVVLVTVGVVWYQARQPLETVEIYRVPTESESKALLEAPESDSLVPYSHENSLATEDSLATSLEVFDSYSEENVSDIEKESSNIGESSLEEGSISSHFEISENGIDPPWMLRVPRNVDLESYLTQLRQTDSEKYYSWVEAGLRKRHGNSPDVDIVMNHQKLVEQGLYQSTNHTEFVEALIRLCQDPDRAAEMQANLDSLRASKLLKAKLMDQIYPAEIMED